MDGHAEVGAHWKGVHDRAGKQGEEAVVVDGKEEEAGEEKSRMVR